MALNQIPEITDLNISQTVCSGESTEEIIFQSNVDETDYSWTLINADTYLSGYDQQGTGDFSIQNIINSNDIAVKLSFLLHHLHLIARERLKHLQLPLIQSLLLIISVKKFAVVQVFQ